jgi:starch synthase
MRAGQPCLAHSVGGLADTIIDNENGFTFNGDNPLQQAENMLSCFQSVLEIKQNNKKSWDSISKNVLKARFLWSDVAHDYIKNLYSNCALDNNF